MESLRYLPWLSPEGWLITNTVPFNNITNYPDLVRILERVKQQKHHLTLDAEAIAKKLGTVKAANIVMLGAATPYLGIEYENFEKALRDIFGRKGEQIVKMNSDALKSGYQIAASNN